jgi:hypothetical protein
MGRGVGLLSNLLTPLWLAIVSLSFFTPTLAAQQVSAPEPPPAVCDSCDDPKPAPSAVEAIRPSAEATSQHRFWDKTNIWLFSGVAVMRALDYTSTRNMQARGREEILLPDDVVNNSAGFAALEAAGAMTSVGVSYIFHRTQHHSLERWMSIGHISVAGFGDARNYALKSKHPR